jgi:hypothetical protein
MSKRNSHGMKQQRAAERQAGRWWEDQEWQTRVMQARQKWLGHTVAFDLGQGQGVQYGKVTSISSEGDVFVECFPVAGQRARALAMSLGYLDRTLTLVDG